MRASYLVRQVFRGMRRAPVVQLSAVGAMTAALVLCGTAALGSFNADHLTRHWGRGLHLVVYLEPDVQPARVRSLQSMLEGRPEVSSVRLVTAQQAYERLKRGLGARGALLAGVEQDFLPNSFEVRLSAEKNAANSPLVGLLESLPGVEEVDFLGRWAGRLGTLAALVRGASMLTAMLVALACLYIVASTIRLGVFARRDEIAIQRLLGATDRFVRAPFLLEGAVQGLISAALAAAVLYGVYLWASPRMEASVGTLMTRTQLRFLPPIHVWVGVVGGALLGMVGSRLALAQYRE